VGESSGIAESDIFCYYPRMLKIRLQRVGRKHEPAFRLVLTDSQNSSKSGRAKETLGSYDPRKENDLIKTDRVKYWIEKGAVLTGTVHNLLVNHKIIDAKKVNVLPKKTYTPPVVEAPVEEAPAPAAEVPTEEAPSAPAEEAPAPVEEVAAPAPEAAPQEATEEAPAADNSPASPEEEVPQESTPTE
jgi:small subunit ribosomal protein S16